MGLPAPLRTCPTPKDGENASSLRLFSAWTGMSWGDLASCSQHCTVPQLLVPCSSGLGACHCFFAVVSQCMHRPKCLMSDLSELLCLHPGLCWSSPARLTPVMSAGRAPRGQADPAATQPGRPLRPCAELAAPAREAHLRVLWIRGQRESLRPSASLSPGTSAVLRSSAALVPRGGWQGHPMW